MEAMKSIYQIHCQASRLLKRVNGTRRNKVAEIVRRYGHNILRHQIGVESMSWREYEQLYTKEERDKMYYEQHPRMVYAGY